MKKILLVIILLFSISMLFGEDKIFSPTEIVKVLEENTSEDIIKAKINLTELIFDEGLI